MPAKPSALIDLGIIYCGEPHDAAPVFDRLRKLPNGGVDLIYTTLRSTRTSVDHGVIP